MTKKEIVAKAERFGLAVRTARYGDGSTRYRFFAGERREQNAFSGPESGIFTAVGAKEADIFLSGFYLGGIYTPDEDGPVEEEE